MERHIKYINAQIVREWAKPCYTPSDYHWRAQGIDNLEKKRAELLKTS